MNSGLKPEQEISLTLTAWTWSHCHRQTVPDIRTFDANVQCCATQSFETTRGHTGGLRVASPITCNPKRGFRVSSCPWPPSRLQGKSSNSCTTGGAATTNPGILSQPLTQTTTRPGRAAMASGSLSGVAKVGKPE